jgi:UDP-4-amino-4,6-dideoxy-N-acetyl-beta-L-altrosamine N-acetyltransferase
MIIADKTYYQGELKFVNFTVLSHDLKVEVLSWRNNDNVKKWMFNKAVILLSDHLNFIKKLNTDNANFYWLVLKNEKPMGVIYINNYVETNYSAEWGFYISPALFMSNLGFELFYETINLFFDSFSLRELTGYVQDDNKNALILNSFFGMKHIEYVLRDNGRYSFRRMRVAERDTNNLSLKDIKKKFVHYIASKQYING